MILKNLFVNFNVTNVLYVCFNSTILSLVQTLVLLVLLDEIY